MGCGSSSLKGGEDVGTDAPKPTVPNNNNLQPVGGAPMKQVRTNFSNIDYDAPTETHKGSLLKARAPDELDEGPSRNASYAAPTTGAAGGKLEGETKDGITEHPAAESTPLEPYHTKSDENEPQPTSGIGQHADSKTPNLAKKLTPNFTDADRRETHKDHAAQAGGEREESASSGLNTEVFKLPNTPGESRNPKNIYLNSGNMYMETFENIYLDLSKQPGKCRLSESGLGWKPSGGSEPFTLAGDQIGGAQWSRASKGYELKLITREGDVIQLDGFELEDFDRASKAFKVWYGITVEHKEHALRGWNWGKAEFGRAELAFNVQNRPAFEIPYSEIANTNQAGKNEIAVEFNLEGEPKTNGANGEKAGHTKNRGRKAAAARDELVEMRFYIPGKVSKKDVDGEEPGSDADDDDVEEQDAAKAFYETLMDKAEIGEVAGQTFATFLDILHLTPRGRFDIDMYEESFRLRGKTYDYKVQYQSIKKFFILPKNDDIHTLLVLGLDPPLRQGQTRYAFVVMQLKNDDEVNLDLNMTDELLHSKYEGKLESHYEAPIHSVIARVFKGLSGKRIIQVSKDFNSHHGASGVKCSIKANEGSLYCLEKSFLFVPKPATYVQIDSIAMITMSRVGGALAASRTFDITMTLKGGAGEHQFSNINREEQQPLEDFFKTKNIRFKNEMLDDSATLLKAALDPEDLASSDDAEAVGADRGSADEDDESPDEDFQADSDSDVAEEYDSAHESSGESDAEMADADADGGGEEEERPKKKVKT